MKADHAKTKEDCMTQFVGHGQPIIHVFETAIILNMVKSVKCQFFPTLLVPISWALAIYPCLGRSSAPGVVNLLFRMLFFRNIHILVWDGPEAGSSCGLGLI